MFWAKSGETERVVGRIIQRMTRDMIKGLTGREERAWRKVEMVMEGRRERRWIVQAGIVEVK